MMTLAGVSESDDVGITKKTGPRSITHIKRSAAAAGRETKLEPGTAELCRFIRLLNLINRNCPWAPHPFEVNDAILRELTSNHLNLIVGQQNANRHGPRLRSLIGAELTPSNICWITNRQQGKTTTLSKFIAALAIGSIAGGNLCFVYSTGLDRAQEVVKVNPLIKSKSPIPDPAHQIQIPDSACHDGPGVKGSHRLAQDNVVPRTGGVPENPDCTRQRTHVRYKKSGRRRQRGRSKAKNSRKLQRGQPMGRRRRRNRVHKERLVLPFPPAPDTSQGEKVHIHHNAAARGNMVL